MKLAIEAAAVVGLPGRASADAADGDGHSPIGGGGVGTAVVARANVGGRSSRASLSPLVAVGHGLLAITTLALVLRAALGPAAR